MNTLNLEGLAYAPAKTSTETQSIWSKLIDFADRQSDKKTGWFLFSLLCQGVLFLPVPAVLMYYFSAPIYVLAVTMILFFSNIIAGMGGANIRVLLTLFGASLLAHLLMIAIFTL